MLKKPSPDALISPPRRPDPPRNRRRIGCIYAKEMREVLRDKRVLFGVLISPLLITPLTIILIGYFVGQKINLYRSSNKVLDRKQVFPMYVTTVGLPHELRNALDDDIWIEDPKLEDIENAGNLEKDEDPEKYFLFSISDTYSEAEEMVRTKVVQAALIAPNDDQQTTQHKKTVKLELLFNGLDERSSIVVQRLKKKFDNLNRESVPTHEGQGKPTATGASTRPLVMLSPRNVARIGGDIVLRVLSLILPYFMITATAFGGVATAFDIGAGEKERGTMETLLISPVTRLDIVIGKILTVVTVNIASYLTCLVGLMIPVVVCIAYFSQFVQIEIVVPYKALDLTFLLTLFLALFTSSIMMLISTFSRNQREAQTYFVPLMLLIMFLATMSIVAIEEPPPLGVSLIPILSYTAAIRGSLTGSLTPGFLTLTILSSAAYAALATFLCVTLFKREEVLFRL